MLSLETIRILELNVSDGAKVTLLFKALDPAANAEGLSEKRKLPLAVIREHLAEAHQLSALPTISDPSAEATALRKLTSLFLRKHLAKFRSSYFGSSHKLRLVLRTILLNNDRDLERASSTVALFVETSASSDACTSDRLMQCHKNLVEKRVS